jgi:hypothetical protein
MEKPSRVTRCASIWEERLIGVQTNARDDPGRRKNNNDLFQRVTGGQPPHDDPGKAYRRCAHANKNIQTLQPTEIPTTVAPSRTFHAETNQTYTRFKR